MLISFLKKNNQHEYIVCIYLLIIYFKDISLQCSEILPLHVVIKPQSCIVNIFVKYYEAVVWNC